MIDSGEPLETSDARIKRAKVQIVDAPITSGNFLVPSGVVVITDDCGGIAEALADQLVDFGLEAIVVQHIPGSELPYACDLTSFEATKELVAEIRTEFGNVGGLVHLLPLAKSTSSHLESIQSKAWLESGSVFNLVHHMALDLDQASDRGGAFVIGASALGGTFGFEWETTDLETCGSGGVSGFLKCLAIEWPKLLIRHVDFEQDSHSGLICNKLRDELSDANGPVEVGYRGGNRKTWVAEVESVDASLEPLDLDENSTIVITGGARGITATIAEEIGRRFKSKLVLLGRSPHPQPESPATASLLEMGQIKAELIGQMKANGEKVVPAAIEQRFRILMSNREILNNIAKIEKAGATVEYRSIDVSDSEALSQLVTEIQNDSGIDGFIHGAGVIDDKLVVDKSTESFERVFRTKVDGALVLAKLLDPAKVKFVAFFASIASRFGNRGQSDYAAANDTLCKIAASLNYAWPARVFAVDWGPWSDVGMAAELAKHMKDKGVDLISPRVGSTMFADELVKDNRGHFEIIIGGGAENIATHAGGAPHRQQS